MRFTNLFTLLVASSALAYNIPMKRDEFEDEAQKLGQAFDAANLDQVADELQNGNLPTDNLTTGNLSTTGTTGGSASQPVTDLGNMDIQECTTKLAEMDKCFSNDKNQSFEDACKKFNSKECQTALGQDFSSCSTFGTIYGGGISIYKIACAVDEDNKFCPLAKAAQNDQDLTDSMIEETCKSKACSDNAISGFSYLKDNSKLFGIKNDGVAKLDKTLTSLKEEKCTAAHSGASQIKVGGALLFTLALVLSYF